MSEFQKELRRSRKVRNGEEGVRRGPNLPSGSEQQERRRGGGRGERGEGGENKAGGGGTAGVGPPSSSRVQYASGAALQRSRLSLPSRKPPEPLRRAVAACLSSSHHASTEALRTLQDYLANSSTVDLAYSVLLDHAIAERDRSPPVVAKCVAFLKRYLIRYIPKEPMLQQIDVFSASLITECDSVISNNQIHQPNDPASHQLISNLTAGSVRGLSVVAFASESLVKSLGYVRALVSRHLPSNAFQSAMVAGITHAQSKRSRSFNSQFGAGGMLKRGVSEDKGAGRMAFMHMPGLEDTDKEDNRYIVIDVLKWRWMGGKRQQPWTPSPVMTDSWGIARPQVERVYDFADMGAAALLLKAKVPKGNSQHGRVAERKSSLDLSSEQLMQLAMLTTVTNNAVASSHLRAITALKRQKNYAHQIWDSDFPPNSCRRRSRPLFQYKHYSEQQPLRLSDVELEEVISAVCMDASMLGSGHNFSLTPPSVNKPWRPSIDPSEVAGSVLIKLLIDMYMANPKTAAPLTLLLFEGMLSSTTLATRIRAFDLVLNLGIHAHLLQPVQIESRPVIDEKSTDTSVQLANATPYSPTIRNVNLAEAFSAEERGQSSQASEAKGDLMSFEKVDAGTPQTVQDFELWLLDILFEMLLFLVQMEEADEGVWTSAFSCLLYLISDRGRIPRQRLYGLDIRVLRFILDVSWENSWADEVRCQLVRMASNLLYQISTNDVNNKVIFDRKQLELFGGIEFLCKEYSRAMSMEARRNLFTVMLDYVLDDLYSKFILLGRPFPGDDEINAVVTALCLGDAPECVCLALRLGSCNVGESLARSVTTAMARDVSSGRLNILLLEEMTMMIDLLVANYARQDQEFEDLVLSTMNSKGLASIQGHSPFDEGSVGLHKNSHSWETLHLLLHSPKESYCHYGYSWLLELLSTEMSLQKGNRPDFIKLTNQFALIESLEIDKGDTLDATKKGTISSAVLMLCGLLKSNLARTRMGFLIILERLLLRCQQAVKQLDTASHISSHENDKHDGVKSVELQELIIEVFGLMNAALYHFVSANDTDHINILQMCDIMFSQLCVKSPLASINLLQENGYSRDNVASYGLISSSGFSGGFESSQDREAGYNTGPVRNPLFNNVMKENNCRSSSMAATILEGLAAAPEALVASIPTSLLYWPLLQLAGAATEDMTLGVAVGSRGKGILPGGASDVRAALLIFLIGKCTIQPAAFVEVGGEEFFRSLLDDADARIAYYTAAFLLKRMMTEEPEKYQCMLHSLVFKAQQSNNEKLLENPYLQMHGIMQLLSDNGNLLPSQEA